MVYYTASMQWYLGLISIVLGFSSSKIKETQIWIPLAKYHSTGNVLNSHLEHEARYHGLHQYPMSNLKPDMHEFLSSQFLYSIISGALTVASISLNTKKVWTEIFCILWVFKPNMIFFKCLSSSVSVPNMHQHYLNPNEWKIIHCRIDMLWFRPIVQNKRSNRCITIAIKITYWKAYNIIHDPQGIANWINQTFASFNSSTSSNGTIKHKFYFGWLLNRFHPNPRRNHKQNMKTKTIFHLQT